MRKSKILLALVLCLAMILSLAGCGKSAAVKETEELIKSIGEVTVDSKDAIETAENAYAALSEADQKAVSNYGVLTAAREALDAAELEALKQGILGTWQFEGDYASGMEAQVNASLNEGLPEFHLDSFPITIRYTFHEDGTYEAEEDAEVFQTSMQEMMKALGIWMDDIILKALADALAQQGISGDLTTWEGMESAVGMSKAEIYQEMLGMSLEEFLDLILENIPLDQMEELGKSAGKYELELGKLFMTEGTDKEVTKTDYTKIAISDRVMTWISYVGNNQSPFAYPVIFDRVG